MTALTIIVVALVQFALIAHLRQDLERLQKQVLEFVEKQNQLNESMIDAAMARTMREQGIPGKPQDVWRAAGLQKPE